jgi:glycine dehydrogenase subunit 2
VTETLERPKPASEVTDDDAGVPVGGGPDAPTDAAAGVAGEAAAPGRLPDRVTAEGSLGPRLAVGAALQPTLAELSRPGRGGDKIPHPPADALDGIPADQRRALPLALPELNEPEVIRHFVNLSHLNYSVDGGFYPLGSCTMKYNPKINEWAARLPGFATLHPLAPDATAQGTLQLLHELQDMLAEISGMHAVTLQPAAGAQGELTGILLIRAYHHARGDAARDEVIVPDSSHGTNPATASMAGFRTVTVRSAPDGGVDLDALKAALGPRTAAVMLTNPSTLGLFERRITELLDAVHAAGALAYMDGANMNAVLGKFKPGAAGFDVMHFNLHKTFSTPHGGGGPGAGPVAVAEKLAPFLPSPLVVREPDGTYRLEAPGERPTSIGRVRAYQGNAGVLVRAYTYIRAHGGSGLTQVSEDAVLAANYLRKRVGEAYELPYPGPCKHEFVATAGPLHQATGVRTLDVAKRLIDYGYHPPTIYFPLIVEECLLIEPTETESIETLDAFADALLAIAREATETPQVLHDAPTTAPVRRLDEATAARHPDLRWRPMTGAEAPCPS